jgi:hypothetical protein
LQTLYGKFASLYISGIADKARQEAVSKEIQQKGIMAVASSPEYTIEIDKIRELQEFRFHPFIDRIVQLFI